MAISCLAPLSWTSFDKLICQPCGSIFSGAICSTVKFNLGCEKGEFCLLADEFRPDHGRIGVESLAIKHERDFFPRVKSWVVF